MPSVALVDDHSLLRNGLSALLQKLDFTITFEADNGLDFQEKLKNHPAPDLVLMDINMPKMDGHQTTLWLKKNHPEIPVLTLSMYDDETSIIRMLKSGARGYVLKDIDASELQKAINEVINKGFYYSDLVSGKLMHAINTMDEENSGLVNLVKLNERETEFLKYTCTDLTYKEIASKMFLSPRTIDGYRDALFEKLNVKTRIGLAMYCIKHRIVDITV